MRKSRLSGEQIIGILKEHRAGLPAAELCRKHGISDAAFYIGARLDQIVESDGLPFTMVSDSAELTSHALLAQQQERSVAWHYIAPARRCGTPSSRA